MDGLPALKIDAIVHHRYGVFTEKGVGTQDVLSHALAYSNDLRRTGECRCLNPAADAVSPAELLSLPRAQRFEAVGSYHVRNAVKQ